MLTTAWMSVAHRLLLGCPSLALLLVLPTIGCLFPTASCWVVLLSLCCWCCPPLDACCPPPPAGLSFSRFAAGAAHHWMPVAHRLLLGCPSLALLVQDLRSGLREDAALEEAILETLKETVLPPGDEYTWKKVEKKKKKKKEEEEEEESEGGSSEEESEGGSDGEEESEGGSDGEEGAEEGAEGGSGSDAEAEEEEAAAVDQAQVLLPSVPCVPTPPPCLPSAPSHSLSPCPFSQPTPFLTCCRWRWAGRRRQRWTWRR